MNRNTRKDYITFWVMIGFIAIMAIALSVTTESKPRPLNYYAYANTLNLAEIIDTNKLTNEALTNRNGKLIIERCIGVVEDASTGAGYIIDNDNFYISYSNVHGIKDGNVICTYLIYNPNTNEIDDIISRFDYIIETGNILE